jgi:hypothetical protein
MNRTRTILLILFISLLPLSFTSGQEKRNEQKIKVIIADKSGTKVVIDTTFSGSGTVDSILLKDGQIVYIGKNDLALETEPGRHRKIIARVGENGKNYEHQYIYINDDKDLSDISNDKLDVNISDDELDNDTDKTKFVIAKNGITVSIEGNDEVKVKELAGEIEKRLDINKDETSSKPAVKEIGKKTVKKK